MRGQSLAETSGKGDALDGARETLVALGVVVLETNLKFDGLNEVAPLLFCA